MAEEDEKEQKGTEGDKKSRKRRVPVWLWFVVLGTVQVAATLGGFYLIMPEEQQERSIVEQLAEDAAADTETEEAGEELRQELQEGEELLGAIFPLEVFIVNLKDSGFIRLEAQIEFTERDVPERIFARIPLIRDSVIAILAQKKREDVLSAKGKKILKQDIKTVVNERLRTEVVKQVLFTQYIIQ